MPTASYEYVNDDDDDDDNDNDDVSSNSNDPEGVEDVEEVETEDTDNMRKDNKDTRKPAAAAAVAVSNTTTTPTTTSATTFKSKKTSPSSSSNKNNNNKRKSKAAASSSLSTKKTKTASNSATNNSTTKKSSTNKKKKAIVKGQQKLSSFFGGASAASQPKAQPKQTEVLVSPQRREELRSICVLGKSSTSSATKTPVPSVSTSTTFAANSPAMRVTPANGNELEEDDETKTAARQDKDKYDDDTKEEEESTAIPSALPTHVSPMRSTTATAPKEENDDKDKMQLDDDNKKEEEVKEEEAKPAATKDAEETETITETEKETTTAQEATEKEISEDTVVVKEASPLKEPVAMETDNDDEAPEEPKAKACIPEKDDEKKQTEDTETLTATNDNQDTAKISASLSESAQLQLAKYQSMRELYAPKALALLEQCQRLNQQERSWDVSNPKAPDDATSSSNTEFPDYATPLLCLLVEGQTLPIAQLAPHVTAELQQAYPDQTWDETVVAQKIPIVANPKTYVKNPNVVQPETTEEIWRWHVEVMDLPAAAKKVRAQLRKMALQLNNSIKLLASLDEAQQVLLQNDHKKKTTARLEKLATRVAQEEEKVQKLEAQEREAEAKRQRLVEQEQLKERQKDEKNKLKRQALEGKQRQKEEKERLAQEKEQEKQQAEREKIQAKRLKEEEAERAQQTKKAKIQKQANFMSSFLAKAATSTTQDTGASSSPKSKPATRSPAPHLPTCDNQPMLSILSEIGENSSAPSVFPLQPSERARRRRSRTVTRTVFVTDPQDTGDAWAQEPQFAQERSVRIRSLYKFFMFHKDVRPPYFGTWSKRSKLISPKNPCQTKDGQFFDYEYDSEAEWEEGDAEVGEALNGDDDDEEEPEQDYEFQGENNEDGFFVQDDDVDDFDQDEEAKHLRKKLRTEDRTTTPLVLIAPGWGGQPFYQCSPNNDKSPTDMIQMEGIEETPAEELLQSHVVLTLNDCQDDLDQAFPPALTDEVPVLGGDLSGTNSNSSNNTPSKSELSEDDMKKALQMIHRSTLSKDKVVDQVRSELFPSLSKSYLQKTLDSVADKTKHPVRGMWWQVKPEALEQSGLSHLMAQDDDEATKKEHLRSIARLIHHSTASSKEKLAEELQTAYNQDAESNETDETNSGSDSSSSPTANNNNDSDVSKMSKAESQRLVDELGQKVKIGSNCFWQVKPEQQAALDLENLPSDPPVTK